MSNHLDNAKRGFVKGGFGTYTCRICKHNTRSTGRGDNENVRLCEICFDLGGEENSLSDNGEFYQGPAAVLGMIVALVARGSDASAWSDLESAARAALAAK